MRTPASVYGSLYDWTVDVTCAAVMSERLHALPVLGHVPAQVYARQQGRHVSGRALLTVGAMLLDVASRAHQ